MRTRRRRCGAAFRAERDVDVRQQPGTLWVSLWLLRSGERRMADWHVSKAETWAELVVAHERFVADYNHQVQWAHRDRQDGRHSPAEVLGWVQGKQRDPAKLHRIFYTTRFGRRLDKLGYVRLRHWRI